MPLAGLAVLLSLAGVAGPAARAADSPKVTTGSSFLEERFGAWEFGLDWGIIIPAQKGSFSHNINNQRAYDLLAAEAVGDEVAEGFIAPPLPGSSNVNGTLKNDFELGLHLYRHFASWLDFGLDGGYGFSRRIQIDSRGVYLDRNFMHLDYNGNLMHLAAPAKMSLPLGSFRPYLLAGPGVYLVRERATISFNDADDPQLKPIGIIVRNAVHPGACAGAGFEWRLAERGLIGLDVQYHKVFAGGDRVDFLLPKMRFSVAF